MFEKKEEKTSGETWKAMVRGFLDSFVKNFAGNFLTNIKARIEEGIENLKRNLFAGALAIVGIVFLLVGAALVLDQIIGFYRGLGYLIMGALLMLIVLIIKAIKK